MDVNAKTSEGETALGFATLRGRTPIVDLLLEAGATADAPAGPARGDAGAGRVGPRRDRADRAAAAKDRRCVSQEVGLRVVPQQHVDGDDRGRGPPDNGIQVDEEMARESLKTVAKFIDAWRDRALQGVGIPGDMDTVSYILLGLGAEKYSADAATDAMAYFLKRTQAPTGQWRILAHRPPLESSDIQVTAASMRALQLYAPKRVRAEYDKAVHLAAGWLANATPVTTEERAFQLLGLRWSGASRETMQTAGRALVAEQRADGGWSQLASLTSDAYTTGQALVALAESGVVATTHPVYKRGVQFLLSTQFEDGSWFVKSRAIALQPLFEIGFPHGRDQWISAAGTNWATLALTRAYVKGSRAAAP